MHTDKGTIKDQMDYISGMEFGEMQINDERFETEKNILNRNFIGALGVHRW
ncbi:MAG TPA: hypothetical protein PLX69_13530 [Leptospiraceae bacterium]|nr:hypothetical protein [Leptospiraceae bacterium]HRG75576.1 hypothetical protein [Leptospiraceae bacterium]